MGPVELWKNKTTGQFSIIHWNGRSIRFPISLNPYIFISILPKQTLSEQLCHCSSRWKNSQYDRPLSRKCKNSSSLIQATWVSLSLYIVYTGLHWKVCKNSQEIIKLVWQLKTFQPCFPTYKTNFNDFKSEGYSFGKKEYTFLTLSLSLAFLLCIFIFCFLIIFLIYIMVTFFDCLDVWHHDANIVCQRIRQTMYLLQHQAKIWINAMTRGFLMIISYQYQYQYQYHISMKILHFILNTKVNDKGHNCCCYHL